MFFLRSYLLSVLPHHHWSLSPSPGRFCPGQSEPMDLSEGSRSSFAYLSVGPSLFCTLVPAKILPPAPLGGPLAGCQGWGPAIWPPPEGGRLQKQPWRLPCLPPSAPASHDRSVGGKNPVSKLNQCGRLNTVGWLIEVTVSQVIKERTQLPFFAAMWLNLFMIIASLLFSVK